MKRQQNLVAFKSLASTSDRQKYIMICKAYVRTLPHSPNVGAPVERQMVTVWPIDTVDNALKASNPLEEETCEFVVNHYGLEAAHDALDDPQIARYVQGKRGPFLLAWAPTATKGTPDALVLVSDLSYVSTDESAKRLFERWREEIENDPSLWDNDGWSIEKISIKIADWADYIAPRALSLIPGFS
jgi:hypothetical protein